MVARAADWILARRNIADGHWGKSVNPLALLAMSNSPGWDANTPEAQVALKQMDIDFLFDRLK